VRDREPIDGILNPYRVLDLTDEKGLLCGKMLGDLGADVIKIERPGGDPARNIGPFYHDEVDPEKSLFWWAFNTSKRGITLDIETAEGQETFKKLVGTADFVIESFPPGYLEKLGLDYSKLEKINPGIIMVSITPFGQTGPYKDYKAPDIVGWAMGGQMYQFGDADRPPIRISQHAQSHLHAAGEGAVAAMLALYHRQITGEGQHIDVSIQESVVPVADRVTGTWDMMKVNLQRGGLAAIYPITLTRIWPCKDGHIIWFYFGGVMRHLDQPFLQWMEEEGRMTDFIRNTDWETLDWRTTTQDVVDRLEEVPARFFMEHTKAELYGEALRRRVILYPVSTAKDIVDSLQLEARNFWQDVEHPELNTSVKYPGSWIKTTEISPKVWCRAPLIGEHNQEVLGNITESTTVHSGTTNVKIEQKKPSRLLEGIKVVDFTWNIVGPFTTKYLSDYGAEVIKLENENRPDPGRTFPYKDGEPGLNREGSWAQWNTNKLSLSLNLGHPKGIEIAKKLVARVDIVANTFAAGVMERMGLGYEELKKIKSDIIMFSSCMQGQDGPHAQHAGFGYHLSALSGFSHLAGWPDGKPQWLGPYTDFPAPHFSALAVLAALDYRRRTGKGQHIEMSQYETGVHFLSPTILEYVVNNRVASREGNRYACAAPHGAYRCLGDDRWCAIAVFTDEEWQNFCKVIGNQELAYNPRFSTLKARKENEDELDILVERWTIQQTAEEVMTLMQSAGVPAGILQHGQDLLERDPQLKHRNYFRELKHPVLDIYHSFRPPFIMSKVPCEITRSPLLGENTEYVLKEVLSMSDDDIAQLVIEGII